MSEIHATPRRGRGSVVCPAVFDDYQHRQHQQSNNAGKIVGIVLACVSLSVALIRCGLVASERRRMDDMNQLFSSSAALTDYSARTATPTRIELPVWTR